MTATLRSPLILAQRCALLAAVAFVYLVGLGPSLHLVDWALEQAGRPAYAGLWKFIPHVILYSTLPALCAAICWYVCVRLKLLEPIRFGAPRRALLWGALGAGVALIATLIFFAAIEGPGVIHYIPPDPWSIAGNVFSNFYEEFIFRGFVLVALTRVVGFWPAALLGSLGWGLEHQQYPLALRFFVAGMGVWFCWLAQRGGGLGAPYVAHMLVDITGDSLIG